MQKEKKPYEKPQLLIMLDDNTRIPVSEYLKRKEEEDLHLKTYAEYCREMGVDMKEITE